MFHTLVVNAPSEGDRWEFCCNSLCEKARMMQLPEGEKSLMMCFAVLTRITSVIDWYTEWSQRVSCLHTMCRGYKMDRQIAKIMLAVYGLGLESGGLVKNEARRGRWQRLEEVFDVVWSETTSTWKDGVPRLVDLQSRQVAQLLKPANEPAAWAGYTVERAHDVTTSTGYAVTWLSCDASVAEKWHSSRRALLLTELDV